MSFLLQKKKNAFHALGNSMLNLDLFSYIQSTQDTHCPATTHSFYKGLIPRCAVDMQLLFFTPLGFMPIPCTLTRGLTTHWRGCVLSRDLHCRFVHWPDTRQTAGQTLQQLPVPQQKQSCINQKGCHTYGSQFTHTARGIFRGALFKNTCYKINTVTSVQHRDLFLLFKLKKVSA